MLLLVSVFICNLLVNRIKLYRFANDRYVAGRYPQIGQQ